MDTILLVHDGYAFILPLNIQWTAQANWHLNIMQQVSDVQSLEREMSFCCDFFMHFQFLFEKFEASEIVNFIKTDFFV